MTAETPKRITRKKIFFLSFYSSFKRKKLTVGPVNALMTITAMTKTTDDEVVGKIAY